jgi:hypothetical protein
MRRINFSVALVLAVALAAWAGDPWKQKAYKDWDDNDLRRILFDSPWAKKVSITLSGGMPSVQGGPPAQSPAAGGGSYGMSGSWTAGGGTPQSVYTAAGKMMSEMTFVVRWFSALTTRRAIARSFVRSHALTEEQAEQGLGAPVDDYMVLLLGNDLSDFKGLDEAGLRKISYLRPRKTKEKIFPLKVDVQNGPDGKTINAIVFHFEKKLPNGEITIPVDEKSIDFSCEVKNIAIHTTFEPPKMMGQEGPDW